MTSTLTQLYGGGPAAVPVGDCYRTALACVLGFDSPKRVPHFTELSIRHLDTFSRTRGGSHDLYLTRQWLREIGETDMATFNLEELEHFAATHELETLPVIATVPSRNLPTLFHSIVWDVVHGRTIVDPACSSTDDPYRPDEVVEIRAIVRPYDPDPDTLLALTRDDHPCSTVDTQVFFHPDRLFNADTTLPQETDL